MDRNDRDRQQTSKHNVWRMKMYFIGGNNDDIRNISSQQILDSLHCFFYHTLRINTNDLINKYKINKNQEHQRHDKEVDLNQKMSRRING